MGVNMIWFTGWLFGDGWERHELSQSEQVTGINGKTLRGWVMRRKFKGQWEYDALSGQEFVDLHLDANL